MRIKTWLITSLMVVVAISAAMFRGASAQTYLRQFTALDAAAGDEFARAIALDGNVGIVGAPSRNESGIESGAAYLFDVATGEQLIKLVPDDSRASLGFGNSVSIDGNLAVVGAMQDDAFGRASGAAYIFDVATGNQLYKLTADDAAVGDEFGVSVAVENGVVIVGSHMDGAGSAYLFDASSGQQLKKLRAADAAPDDLFGVAVALSNGKALVGARYDDDLGIASGSAYIFDVDSGQQLHKLNAHDGVRGDRYGMHLDIGGDRAVVGARYDDDEKKSSGSAYVYDVNTGEQLFKLVPDDTTRNDQFGSAISISGDLALIGALDDDHNGPYAGSAYLFNVRTGEQLHKFNAIDAMPFDRMGIAAAMDGETVVVGASMLNYEGAPNLATGKAYVYAIPEPSSFSLVGFGIAGFASFVRRRKLLT